MKKLIITENPTQEELNNTHVVLQIVGDKRFIPWTLGSLHHAFSFDISKLDEHIQGFLKSTPNGGAATPDAPERECACNRCMYSWDGNSGICPVCRDEATHGRAFANH